MILYSYETFKDNSLIFNLVAPGMKKEDFKVETEEDIFTVKTEDYEKVFKLPKRFKTKDISAKYEAGILKIIFELKKPKEIEVT